MKTNEEIANDIAKNAPCNLATKAHIKQAVLDVAKEKDDQLIVMLGGWNSREETPGSDCYCIVELKTSFPKNCRYVVAEYDYDAKCFYFESDDEPIEQEDIVRWKVLCF